jgi:5,10-methylenetetrahydromethanopterin reductase
MTGPVARGLGTYVLPGRVVDPTQGALHAVEAERLGLQSVWLSERWDQKDAPSLLGAMAHATERVRIGTAVIHPHTRHPVVLASMAITLQWLSGGRFVLGLGRGIPATQHALGLPSLSTRALRDTADVLRRLWAGEEVAYEGPLGTFPALRVDHAYQGPPPPLALAAIGPRTLELAGEAFDAVILHPLLSTDAVAESIDLVRGAADRAGRDPASVRVYATVVVACDLPGPRSRAIVGGRAVTYLQMEGYGDLLARVNHWDPAALQRVRAHPVLASLAPEGLGALADQRFSLEQLAEVADVLPSSWIDHGAAIGTATEVASRLDAYLDAGADELILHGNPPADLAGVVDASIARSG